MTENVNGSEAKKADGTANLGNAGTEQQPPTKDWVEDGKNWTRPWLGECKVHEKGVGGHYRNEYCEGWAALSPAESPDLADTPDAQPELEDKIEEILNFYHQEMNRTVPAEHLQGRHSVTIGLAKGHLLSLLKQERKSAKREVLEELMVDPWIEPRSQSKNIAYERLERELANLDEDE